MTIRIDDIEFVSGQEPDGLDDEWAADMIVRGRVDGTTDLARLLGVQERMLDRHLEKPGAKKAIAARLQEQDDRTSRGIIADARSHAVALAYALARDELGRQGSNVTSIEIIDVSSVEILRRPSQGFPEVAFEIEVATAGRFGKRTKGSNPKDHNEQAIDAFRPDVISDDFGGGYVYFFIAHGDEDDQLRIVVVAPDGDTAWDVALKIGQRRLGEAVEIQGPLRGRNPNAKTGRVGKRTSKRKSKAKSKSVIRDFIATKRRRKWKVPRRGGLADGKAVTSFEVAALARGLAVELEHTDDMAVALGIAMDHLTEDPDYYTKLATIEKGHNPSSQHGRDVEELRARLLKKHPLRTLHLHDTVGDAIRIDAIRIEPAARGGGHGSKVMQELVAWADANERTIVLTPSPDWDVPERRRAAEKKRLERWYKTFGFVPNKGRNKDFLFTDTMIRRPNSKPRRKANPEVETMNVRALNPSFDPLRLVARQNPGPRVRNMARRLAKGWS